MNIPSPKYGGNMNKLEYKRVGDLRQGFHYWAGNLGAVYYYFVLVLIYG